MWPELDTWSHPSAKGTEIFSHLLGATPLQEELKFHTKVEADNGYRLVSQQAISEASLVLPWW